MESSLVDQNAQRSTRRRYAAALCAAGLLVNIAGVQLARATGVPLYLDNIGSALAAALGGTIPGIVAIVQTVGINKCTTVEAQQKKMSSARVWCIVGTILGILAIIGNVAAQSMN